MGRQLAGAGGVRGVGVAMRAVEIAASGTIPYYYGTLMHSADRCVRWVLPAAVSKVITRSDSTTEEP
jgi:hypothetical protein